MADYIACIGFWLHAYEQVTFEATSDAEARALAIAAAREVMARKGVPDHIDYDERRQGVVGYVDREDEDGREPVAELIAFDDDRINPPEPGPDAAS
ncbi:hypothetical protein FHR90_003413 [Endobacter medicaginis]|uniref:Uncharacterized protein n=1 Tax=Endobacter medicaginis TaxID=1181271 RepID=A0A850NKI9_9PROT|nr:hypothetical protein [Endobacter medicaginis]MBB3175557.1 hypothetical protein [Endobacter medicaginis]MCX5476937.1 hypothetical protein [Endobacter medicaginis]NVN29434.1 hypothetical protein [Endobacter medicaginis]